MVRVSSAGHIHPPKATQLEQLYLGIALQGLYVGLRELDDGSWLISLGNLRLGVLKQREHRLTEPDLHAQAG